MQFTDDEWVSFAQKLKQLTDSGRIQWKRLDDSWNANVYRATVPENAKYTIYSRDADGQFPYVLEIKELDDTKVSEFTTVAYDDVFVVEPQHLASRLIDNLYAHVARLVTGAPQRVQSLLHGLDELLPENDGF